MTRRLRRRVRALRRQPRVAPPTATSCASPSPALHPVPAQSLRASSRWLRATVCECSGGVAYGLRAAPRRAHGVAPCLTPLYGIAGPLLRLVSRPALPHSGSHRAVQCARPRSGRRRHHSHRRRDRRRAAPLCDAPGPRAREAGGVTRRRGSGVGATGVTSLHLPSLTAQPPLLESGPTATSAHRGRARRGHMVLLWSGHTPCSAASTRGARAARAFQQRRVNNAERRRPPALCGAGIKHTRWAPAGTEGYAVNLTSSCVRRGARG